MSVYLQVAPFSKTVKADDPSFGEFVDPEVNAFMEWTGLADKKAVVADVLPGFEHNFLLLRNKGSEKHPGFKEYLNFRTELSGDAVMGDVGTSFPDGQCLANRCRWVFRGGRKSFQTLLFVATIAASVAAILVLILLFLGVGAK